MLTWTGKTLVCEYDNVTQEHRKKTNFMNFFTPEARNPFIHPAMLKVLWKCSITRPFAFVAP